MRPKAKIRLALTPLLASLLLAGCTSVPKHGPRARVHRIEVSFETELAARVRELDALDRVRAGVGAALRRSDLHSPTGSLTLFVHITSLRVRGAETTRWLGIMAGTDKLRLRVRVQRGDEVLEVFEEGLSLASGGSGAVRTSRLTKLVVRVSDDVAEKMRRLDIRDPVSGVARAPTSR